MNKAKNNGSTLSDKGRADHNPQDPLPPKGLWTNNPKYQQCHRRLASRKKREPEDLGDPVVFHSLQRLRGLKVEQMPAAANAGQIRYKATGYHVDYLHDFVNLGTMAQVSGMDLRHLQTSSNRLHQDFQSLYGYRTSI